MGRLRASRHLCVTVRGGRDVEADALAECGSFAFEPREPAGKRAHVIRERLGFGMIGIERSVDFVVAPAGAWRFAMP